jgi:hypothetical protein
LERRKAIHIREYDMADLSSQGIPIQDDPLTTALDKCDINDSHEPTTLLSLPAELVDEIAWYLTPIRNLQYTGFKTPWYGDKPFDCWNADLENLSRVCRALRSGLVERQRERVVVLTEDFEESLQEKMDRIPSEKRERTT